MPELPDIVVYQESLARRIIGQPLVAVHLQSPFVLRTAVPPLASVSGRTIRSVQRIGKRLALGLDGELFLVLHLMIAGRLQWREAAISDTGKGRTASKPTAKAAPRNSIASFELGNGTLYFTEAGSRKRASLHLLGGAAALAAIDPGGLELLQATAQQFAARLTQANHTLKRALTDPASFSGIGNAYSDEILHRAQLSPIALTQKLSSSQIAQLFEAARSVLIEWTDRLRTQTGDAFPQGVTAFRPDMAVHGRFGLPCPQCQAPVQRIVYASNETNYCARCQTAGIILKDRALSRLLKASWPRSIDDL